MTFDEAYSKLKQAKSAELFFGPNPYATYREIAKIVHPDVAPADKRKAADVAFRLLGQLYQRLNGKAEKNHTRIIGKWAVTDPLAKGDLCNLYRAENTITRDEVVFKITREENDNDLLTEEHFHLARLAKVDHATAKNYAKYLPQVFDTFEASGRHVNVLTLGKGYLSLKDILEIHTQLDFRHAVWMVNRALSILGFISRQEVVHGAVLAPHLLFHPVTHGLLLVDWCYAVTAESKKHIPAIVRDYKDFYPPEVLRKHIPTPSTDLYMLFRSIQESGMKIPKRFRALFDHCLAQSPRSRPDDAWQVQDRWIALAKEEYGPPTYIELKIPVT